MRARAASITALVDNIISIMLRSLYEKTLPRKQRSSPLSPRRACASSLLPRFRRSPCNLGSSVKFQKAQEAVEHQIIARQVQLALLGTEVVNAAHLTTTDSSSLVGIITSEQTALETDASNAAAATTYAELDAVQKAVVADERVYAVVTTR